MSERKVTLFKSFAKQNCFWLNAKSLDIQRTVVFSISLASSLNLCVDAEQTGVFKLGKMFNTNLFPSKSFKVIFARSLSASKKSGAWDPTAGNSPERLTICSPNLICVLIFVSILFFFPNKFGYILFRLKSFIDPTKGENYQSEKALEAIKNGGFTGRGLGEGVLKDRVPEAHTDYMFAIIAEEFGAILLLLLIIIFLFFSYKVLHKLLDEKDEYTKLVLVGLISLLLIQTFIHIGVNTSLLPTTGMTLPFLSYGGSSLIGSAILAGIILNYTKIKLDTNE